MDGRMTVALFLGTAPVAAVGVTSKSLDSSGCCCLKGGGVSFCTSLTSDFVLSSSMERVSCLFPSFLRLPVYKRYELT